MVVTKRGRHVFNTVAYEDDLRHLEKWWPDQQNWSPLDKYINRWNSRIFPSQIKHVFLGLISWIYYCIRTKTFNLDTHAC